MSMGKREACGKGPENYFTVRITCGENSMKTKSIACPVCRKKTTWEDNPWRPFCSERCRLIDLGKWASEEYRIAGEKKDIPEESPEEKNPENGR